MSAARGSARPTTRGNAASAARGSHQRGAATRGGIGSSMHGNRGNTMDKKRGGGSLHSIHSGGNGSSNNNTLTAQGQSRGSHASRGSRRNMTTAKFSSGPPSAALGDRDPTKAGSQAQYMRTMTELWQQLRDRRENERRQAIQSGLMADPDKKTSLAEAITPVGTCMEMCPEHERVERVVQQMVDRCERIEAPPNSGTMVPWEPAMVKRFRRSAAGTDAQIPSDIRPPAVLQKTLDYLLDEVVGGPRGLAAVHKFVWDRTRGIRNDFSIQQVTQPKDLALAIECFERIARFHLLSLHQLSRPGIGVDEFDPHQEREQLGNTLLSLMYYYEDSRGSVPAPNEPEFRAYCIVFEIQDRRPDILDRVQTWPPEVLRHPKVQTALRLYAAALNTGDDQGPLLPRASFAVAQANPGRFWAALLSPAVSYLAACAAEVYFNHVRSGVLQEIYRAYRRPSSAKMDDLTLEVLMDMMGFDSEEQTQTFLEEHGFSVKERDDGEGYVDLNSTGGRPPSDHKQNRGQTFSRRIVERKRHGRTLPAIIRGYTVLMAREEGLIDEQEERQQHEDLFVSDEEEDMAASANNFAKSATANPFQAAPASLDQTQAPSKPAANPFAIAANKLTPSALSKQATASQNPFATPTSTTIGSSQTTLNPFADAASSLNQSDQSLFVATKETRPAATAANPFASAAKELGIAEQNPFATAAQSLSNAARTGAGNESTKKPTLHPTNEQIAASVFGTSPSTTPAPSFFSKANAQEGAEETQPVNPFATATASHFSPNLPPPNPFASKEAESSKQQGQEKVGVPQQAQPNPFASFAVGKDPTSTQPESTSLPAKQSEAETGPTFAPNNLTQGSPSVLAPPANTSSLFHGPHGSQQAALTSAQNLEASHHPEPSPTKTAFQQPSVLPPNPRFPPSTSQPQSSFVPKPPSKPKTLSAEEKSQAYDALARKMFLGRGGILEMFVETLMPEIVTKAHRKVERERERARVAEARSMLLSSKYFRRWKQIAHQCVLARTGRERRRAMAQTLRQSLNSTPRSSMSPVQRPADSFFASNLSSSLSKLPASRSNSALSHNESWGTAPQIRASTASSRRSSANAMPPPPSPLQHAKSPTFKKPVAPLHHRRSQTVGSGSGLSSSVHGSRISKYSPLSSTAPSAFRDSSLQSRVLGDPALLKKARRMLTGRTDTTQTDYFRLKALGVDPDTPLISQTRKRPHSIMSSDDGDERRAWSVASSTTNSRAPSVSRMRSLTEASGAALPPPLGRNREPSATPTRHVRPSDEEEELFARVRRVRLEMAESEAWFKSERENTERELSERGSIAGDEMRLRAESAMSGAMQSSRKRDISGSGASTPSRTTVRLQETGAKGLWARWQQMVSEKEAASRKDSEARDLVDDDEDEESEEEDVDNRDADDMDYVDEGEEEDEDDSDADEHYGSNRPHAGRAGLGGSGANGFGQSGASIEDAIEL